MDAGSDPWPGSLAGSLDLITVGGVAPVDFGRTKPYGSFVGWTLPGATVYTPSIGLCLTSASREIRETLCKGLPCLQLSRPDL